MPETFIPPATVSFRAADGYELGGTFFFHPEAKAAVLICTATAVSQRHYHAFAKWLNEKGYAVLTFDYRGIGSSVGGRHLRECPARKQDWGEQDMPAALDWLSARCPNLSLHLVGHSAGGLLIGLMPNHSLLKSVVAVACSTGYIGAMPQPTRGGAGFLLKCYFPLATRIFGYLPAKRLGWGEDLPRHVARQWAEWCSQPGYIRNAFGREVHNHYYDQVELPLLLLNAADDPITSAPNISDYLALLPKVQAERMLLVPADFQLKAIGHMGFFQRKSEILWSLIARWLDARGQD